MTVLLRCCGAVSVGLLMLAFAAPEWRAHAQDTKKAAKKPAGKKGKPLANTDGIDTKAEQAQITFIKETEAIASEYYDAGHLDKARAMLETIQKLSPGRPQVEAKLRALDEQMLSANPFSVEVNAGKPWESSRTLVTEGKAFRVKVDGTYRLILNSESNAAGVASQDVQRDMVPELPLGMLIGLIVQQNGKPGAPFPIGPEREVTPKESGILLLKVNVPPDNKCTGKLKVELSGHIRTGGN